MRWTRWRLSFLHPTHRDNTAMNRATGDWQDDVKKSLAMKKPVSCWPKEQ
jgi:hypothetical protein